VVDTHGVLCAVFGAHHPNANDDLPFVFCNTAI
jgi:hypothetical protein